MDTNTHGHQHKKQKSYCDNALSEQAYVSVSPEVYDACLARLDAAPNPSVRLRKTMSTPAPWGEAKSTYPLYVHRIEEIMRVNSIHTKLDYESAMARIDELWGAPVCSQDGGELEVLATLVEAYEAEHYPIAPPDPVEAIKFRKEQDGN